MTIAGLQNLFLFRSFDFNCKQKRVETSLPNNKAKSSQLFGARAHRSRNVAQQWQSTEITSKCEFASPIVFAPVSRLSLALVIILLSQ